MSRQWDPLKYRPDSPEKADADAATRSLYWATENRAVDFSQEITVYEAVIQAQTEILKKLGTQAIHAMQQLAQLLG